MQSWTAMKGETAARNGTTAEPAEDLSHHTLAQPAADCGHGKAVVGCEPNCAGIGLPDRRDV